MSTHTKMWHFKRTFLIFMKNPDFWAKSGPLGPKKSGAGLKCGNPDQSGGTGYSTNKIMINILNRPIFSKIGPITDHLKQIRTFSGQISI